MPAIPTANPAPIATMPIAAVIPVLDAPKIPAPTNNNTAIRKPYKACVSGKTENNIDLPIPRLIK